MDEGFSNGELPLLHAVDSSSIGAAGYDARSSRLVVRFRSSGETYVYYLVPVAKYEALLSAESPGAYLNREIKPNHAFEKL